MGTTNVLLIEPDAAWRRCLVAALAGDRSLKLVGAGSDLIEAGNACLSPCQVHAILLNIDAPEMFMDNDWATIHLLFREARIVALTDGCHARALKAAIAARVAGLHLRDADPSILRRALRNASRGCPDYDPQLVQVAKHLLIQSPEAALLRIGKLTIDPHMHEIRVEGTRARMTPLETKVLECLALKINVPVSPDDLLRSAWGCSLATGGTKAQVASCIRRLRRKIEHNPRRPQYLLSVRGWGYILQAPRQDGKHSQSSWAAVQVTTK